MKTKKCSTCKLELPLSLFYPKRKGYGDGYMCICKECNKIYRANHKKQERLNAQLREKRDREEMNEKWWKKNARTHNWRFGNAIDYRNLINIYEIQDKKCYYCGIDLNNFNLNIEHYYPGRDDKIVMACGDCNRLKYKRTGDEFKVFIKEYLSRFSLK